MRRVEFAGFFAGACREFVDQIFIGVAQRIALTGKAG